MSNSPGEALVQRLLESETKADLLLLFRRNPGLIDEIDGVARRVGRRKEAVVADLNDLVEVGVVRKRQVGKMEVYSLDSERDAQVQVAVGNYLAGSRS